MEPWDELLAYWTGPCGRSGLTLQFLAAACKMTPKAIIAGMQESKEYYYKFWVCGVVKNPVCCHIGYTYPDDNEMVGRLKMSTWVARVYPFGDLQAVVANAEEKVAAGKPSRVGVAVKRIGKIPVYKQVKLDSNGRAIPVYDPGQIESYIEKEYTVMEMGDSVFTREERDMIKHVLEEKYAC